MLDVLRLDGLRRSRLDESALGIQGFAVATAFHVGGATAFLVAAIIVLAVGAFAWTYAYRRHRAVADTPTSRVASAPQGFVELFGTARPHDGRFLAGKLTGSRCVWFRFTVEEKTKDGYRRIEGGTSDDTFLLKDATGECVVDADGAWVLPAHRKRWVNAPYRYTEWWIADGDPLYALGAFSSVHPSDGAAMVADETAALLAQWKKDRPALIARFDANGDGEVDVKEWEAARAAARASVLKSHRERAGQSALHVMRAPGGDRPFLLSARPPEDLVSHLRRWMWVHFGTLSLGCGAAILLLAARNSVT